MSVYDKILLQGRSNQNMEGMITLTMKEQKINNIMVKLITKEIKVSDAARILGVTERQIYRKKKLYKQLGIKSIPHQSKNKSNGKGYSNKLKEKILNLYKEEYNGWNFYHFNDTLEDYYNIKVSNYFIYKLLTTNGYESPYKYKKRKEAHPPRERRENAGELIQVDASKHKWFFGIDQYQYLHGGIDDATGNVTSCFFAEQETIYGYQMIMMQTMKNYGIPECLYTDFRTVFKSNKHEISLEDLLANKEIKNTRFANMLEHIGTDIISTMNPRAKGRIERLWRTFQDRLYKELKKNNIQTIEEANTYLNNIFIPKYNARFALPINDTKNIFVSLEPDYDYNKELAVWSEHKVYHNSYLKYNNKYHTILLNNEKAYLSTKDTVAVHTFVDGTEHILFKNIWYDLKEISIPNKPVQEIIKSTKTTIEINASKAHKPSKSNPFNRAPIKKSIYTYYKSKTEI